MASPIASSTAIYDVNDALNKALKNYVDDGVTIVFDLPDMDNLPSEPTVSVFLYEIHEDLQLRTSQLRSNSRDPTTNIVSISPGWVNVSCNYLITYWDPQQNVSSVGSPGSEPQNQAIKVMNQVVNALINNRQLADVPGAYTRMIPPKDELNSLGNFWQALGNRPRLSLHASVTVPVDLTDKKDTAPAVQTTEADMEQILPGGDPVTGSGKNSAWGLRSTPRQVF